MWANTGYVSYQAANLFRTLASHGVRTVDNLREHCRIEDPNLLEVAQLYGLSSPDDSITILERGATLRADYCHLIQEERLWRN